VALARIDNMLGANAALSQRGKHFKALRRWSGAILGTVQQEHWHFDVVSL
jgi:hypothetical protein